MTQKYDPTNEKDVAKAQQARALRRKAQIHDVLVISRLEEGERWFERIARDSFLLETTMQGSHSMANEGRRMLAVACLQELATANPQVCSRIFLRLLREREEREFSERRTEDA